VALEQLDRDARNGLSMTKEELGRDEKWRVDD
jgi:hypothetical protein